VVVFTLKRGDYVKLQYYSKTTNRFFLQGGIVWANDNRDIEIIPLNGNERQENILRIYNCNPRTVVIRKKSITQNGIREHIPNYIELIKKQIQQKYIEKYGYRN
jgi:hypothetical protein